jgi:hypothetical protein
MEKAGNKSAGAGTPKPVPIEIRMVPKYNKLRFWMRLILNIELLQLISIINTRMQWILEGD